MYGVRDFYDDFSFQSTTILLQRNDFYCSTGLMLNASAWRVIDETGISAFV